MNRWADRAEQWLCAHPAATNALIAAIVILGAASILLIGLTA